MCEFSLAQPKLDSLERILPSLSGKERVDVLNELGFNYAFSSIKKAKKYTYQGLEQAYKINYKKGEAHALINVGYSEFDHNNLDSANYYFLQARDLSKAINYKKSLASSVNALGNLMSRMEKNPAALSYFKECLSIEMDVDNEKGQASALNNIGNTLLKVGNYDNAVEYFLKALKINEKRNDTRRIALNLYNLGRVKLEQQERTVAEEYFKQMLDLGPSIGFKNLASGYNLLGSIKAEQQDFEQAKKYFRIALQYNDSSGGRSLYTIWHNQADMHRMMGEYEKALDLANKALDDKRKNSSTESIIFTLDLIADINYEKKDYKAAIVAAEEAIVLNAPLKLKDRELGVLEVLSNAKAKIGAFDDAWVLRMQYENVKDSIFNLKKTEQQASLTSLFETEKKQQTIELQEANLKTQKASLALSGVRNNQLTYGIVGAALLALSFVVSFLWQRKNNRQLNEQKQIIEIRNQEKEVLLKEIHHRVKNNLQIISSILNIQSRKLEDANAKKAVSEGRSRIKSMSLIHEKLYGSDQFSEISMKEYIQELSAYLFKTHKPGDNIKHRIEVEDIKLDIDKAIPLGLILNELISNSLKHAFEGKTEGELCISLTADQEAFTLQVADSGKGLPANFEEIKNMGMRLVNSLTEQIEGQLTVENSNGANFTITF